MKTLKTAVSFMAVVNLLALALFVGWLVQSGRVSRERIERVRETFRMSVAEEAAAAEAAADASARVVDAAEDDAAALAGPSIRRVSAEERSNRVEHGLATRMLSEVDALREQLTTSQAAFVVERERFEAERAAWEEERNQMAQGSHDAQFSRVVALLEAVPARQARDTLSRLAAQGQIGDAVAYLNAMKPFNAAKVLREFKTDDEKRLATELLQRMKALGEKPGALETSPDANPAADSD